MLHNDKANSHTDSSCHGISNIMGQVAAAAGAPLDAEDADCESNPQKPGLTWGKPFVFGNQLSTVKL